MKNDTFKRCTPEEQRDYMTMKTCQLCDTRIDMWIWHGTLHSNGGCGCHGCGIEASDTITWNSIMDKINEIKA